MNIKIYLYWSKNLISMLFSKLIILFGYKYDKSVIPEGPYCYAPDDEKNKNKEPFTHTYYIIPCKYYKTIGKWNGCIYLGIITDDYVFQDQCKMCGENYGNENEN